MRLRFMVLFGFSKPTHLKCNLEMEDWKMEDGTKEEHETQSKDPLNFHEHHLAPA